MRIFEDIIDNISQSEEHTASKVIDVEEDYSNLPIYDLHELYGKFYWIIRVKFDKDYNVLSPQIMEILKDIFDKFKYTINYQICKINGISLAEFKDSEFYFVFNVSKGRIVTFIKQLMIPLYSLIDKFSKDNNTRFFLFGNVNKDEIATSDFFPNDYELQKFLAVLVGNRGVYSDDGNAFWYYQVVWTKMSYDISGDFYKEFNKMKLSEKKLMAFWDFLYWTIFKISWKKQFNKLPVSSTNSS